MPHLDVLEERVASAAPFSGFAAGFRAARPARAAPGAAVARPQCASASVTLRNPIGIPRTTLCRATWNLNAATPSPQTGGDHHGPRKLEYGS
jgi:hypothetical protein